MEVIVSIDDNTDKKFWRLLVRSLARPIIFPRIDDSYCYRNHSSLTSVRCFENGYVGKQQVPWKEYCVEYRLKELQGSMDRCTNRRDITEIPLQIPFNQSFNQFLRTKSVTKKEMNKCMAEIYDPGGIRTRAARLISQYHNH